jgi:predicted transporter
MSSIGFAVLMSIGLLVSSPIAGFALLKSYDDFRKGVDRNSRSRMWSAFCGSSFLFIILISSIVRLVVNTSERSISGYLITIGIVFPAIAAFAGFGLLKAYEIFQKGIEKKSRFRMWSAFLIGAGIFILSAFLAMELVVV